MAIPAALPSTGDDDGGAGAIVPELGYLFASWEDAEELVKEEMDTVGIKDIVAVVIAALTLLPRVISRPSRAPVIVGNLPLLVEATIAGVANDRSSEMPAATFAMAACPAVGVVKDDTETLT